MTSGALYRSTETWIALPVFLFLTVSLLCHTVEAVGGICSQLVDGNFYDLSSLQGTDDYRQEVDGQSGFIIFNLCTFVKSRCIGYNDSYAVYRTEDSCVPLTLNSQTSGYNATLLPGVNATSNTSSGLNISFTGVALANPELGNVSTLYHLELNMACDQNTTGFTWQDGSSSYYDINSTFVVKGSGSASCPKYSGNFIIKFFQSFSYVTAVLAILVGLVQCFYGYRLYRITMFIAGFLFTLIFMVLFLFAIWTDSNSGNLKGVTILAFSVLTAVMIGFLVAAFAESGIVISGAILGFFLATMVYTLVLRKIASMPENLLLYNLAVVGMVIGSLAAYEFQNVILIFSCALTGAYFIVRGVSVFIGGFPNELDLNSGMGPSASSASQSTGASLYIYMGVILLLAIAGILVQTRLKINDDFWQKGNELLRNLANREVTKENQEEEKIRDHVQERIVDTIEEDKKIPLREDEEDEEEKEERIQKEVEIKKAKSKVQNKSPKKKKVKRDSDEDE